MSERTVAPRLPDDLKSLTAFRFFAAFWVFLFHLRSRIDHPDTWFWDIIDNGARGVDFFFILLTEGQVLNAPSWTLSAEMFAYLAFGLIVVRRPATWMIAGAFVVTALAVHAFAISIGKTAFIHMTSDYGILRIIPSFILGMFLRRLCPQVSPTLASVMGVAGLVSLLWVAQREPAGYEIFIPFALLIVAGARLSDRSWLPTNSQLPVYLGEISYSIYLIHILVIRIFLDYLPALGLPLAPWPAICLALVVGSSLSYHVIEVPARRWINQWAILRRPA